MAGISRGQMARELGVDPATITRWEHDRTVIEPRTVIAYAAVCGVDREWIEESARVTAGYLVAA